LKVCDDVPQCVDDADLIVTVTFASQPVLMSANVKLGAHIMAVGACTPDMAELEPALMQNAQVTILFTSLFLFLFLSFSLSLSLLLLRMLQLVLMLANMKMEADIMVSLDDRPLIFCTTKIFR
jgi:hypothetical protein